MGEMMSERVLGGRYIIQDKIGTGGMAIVYRGLDKVLGRTVAIKTMLPQYAADPSFAARFKQEAQAAAALQSPYIVSVYDWGKDGDTYYIAMEYLRGTDLKSGIKRHGALDCKKVAQIGSQIAKALSVAHRHDIIHRDIKPQNIMVQPDGNIKVMDFGIARAKNSHLTTDNSVLGTAHYVSPEQTQGKELGPTTDIYSLGIVMYEAACGVVPFDGDDAISVALKQVNEQPIPPSQRNSAVDATLESIILKCIQKNPADRFQTADELYHVLLDYLAGRIAAVTAQLPITQPVSPKPVVNPKGDTARFRSIDASGTIGGQTATERARLDAQMREKQHKRRIIVGTILGALALALTIIALVSFISNHKATQAVPNLLNLTQEQALSTIENTGFQKGSVKEQYSSSVAKGLVVDQNPDSGTQAPTNTQIDIVISKGPEPAATVTVPDISNMTPSQAEEALAKVGLKGQAGDSVYDSDIEVGKIAAQSPAAQTDAKAGDTVTYQLSKGVEQVDVPNVVGYSESDAKSALSDAGFNSSVQYRESNNVEKGQVISQSPSSGTAARGSEVTLVVSSGGASIDVSQFVGSTEQNATNSLENLGVNVSVKYEHSSQVKSGVVISVSPNTIKKGGSVTLTVSSGPASSSSGQSDSNTSASGSHGNSSGGSSSDNDNSSKNSD